MRLCIVCTRLDHALVCESCASEFRAGPVRRLPDGLVVRSGLLHQGAARVLVHHLKYRGILDAARCLAVPMARRMPEGATALIPVPRATTRRLRYGVDPALELAGAVGRLTGVPVVSALRPAMWWRRHAPRPADARAEPRFRLDVSCVPEGAVLVDDVFRTGATVRAALRVLGTAGHSALAATAPPGYDDAAGVPSARRNAHR